jgi:ketosteroid isomerase-like protein
MHALEKDREARPQTARELAREFEAAVSGAGTKPIAARETVPTPAPTVETSRPTILETAPPVRMPIHPHAPPPPQPYQQPYLPRQADQQPGARRGLMAVAIVIIVLAIGAIGLVAYLYFFNRPERGNQNIQAANSRLSPATNTRPIEPSNANSGGRTTSRSNTNAAPTNPPPGTAVLAGEVRVALQSWAAALRSHDLEAYMAHYADVLEIYYNRQNARIDFVREDKARAFRLFSSLNVQIADYEVSFDPSGTRAVATFTKSWRFSGDRVTTGSVKQEMRFVKTAGRWLITGEKDLDVYR